MNKTISKVRMPCWPTLACVGLILVIHAAAQNPMASTTPSPQTAAQPSATPPTSPSPLPESGYAPQASSAVAPTSSPTPSPTPLAARSGPEVSFPPLNDRELVVTAVGDVMLGTTFPDETGGLLPPNDGADILREVTPILKRGDVVFGNLEGPLTEGGTSAKCRGKALGTCYAFRVPPRYGAH
ncbi:MAG TPA: CapA family protein, partial [Candidatus Angelobacter sp.]|nr:CapA family protein [Candidatus Angelobacter sp.]